MTTDQTAADVRDRIAAVAAPFFANFADEDAAKVNADELADAVLGVLPEPSDRAATLRELEQLARPHTPPSRPEQRVDAVPTLVPRAVRPLDIEHDELMARAAAEHQARTAADQARKTADRAAVLLEAAERVTAHAADHFPAEYDQYADALADELRRMADEEQPAIEARQDGAQS